MTCLRFAPTTLLAVLFLIPAASSQERQRKSKDAGPAISGELGRVDATKNTITIGVFSRADAQVTDKTFTVAKDADIVQDGVKTKLEGLSRGHRAKLTLSADEKLVVAISVVGGTIQATFKTANFDRNTITVIAGRNMEDKVLHLIKDTKITLEGGKVGGIRDLKTGSRLLITTSVEDSNTAIAIQTAPAKSRPE